MPARFCHFCIRLPSTTISCFLAGGAGIHIGRSYIILEAEMKESPCTTFDCEPLKSWVYGRRMRIAPQNNDASGRSGGRLTHRSNAVAAKLKMTTALLPRGAAAPLIRRRMIPAAFCSMDSVSVSQLHSWPFPLFSQRRKGPERNTKCGHYIARNEW